MLTEEMAKHYCRIKNRIFLGKIIFMLLYLFIMTYSFSLPLRNAIGSIAENPIILGSVYFFIVYVFYLIFSFPLRYYEEFILTHKFELSEQTFLEWIKQVIRKEWFIYFIFLLIIQMVYFFIEVHSGWWWVWVSGNWIFFGVISTHIFRYLVRDRFCKYKPVAEEELKQKIIILAKKAGITINDIYLQDTDKDTQKANVILAFIKTKRLIILNKEVVDYAPEEIEVLAALELAGYYYGHHWKLALLRSTAIVAGCFVVFLLFRPATELFGFKPVYNIASLPLLGFLFLMMLILFVPFQNAFMRRMEREADEFSLSLTGAPEAFVSLMIRMAEQNLSDPNPNRIIEMLLYKSLPVPKRIMLAEDYAQSLFFKDHGPRF